MGVDLKGGHPYIFLAGVLHLCEAANYKTSYIIESVALIAQGTERFLEISNLRGGCPDVLQQQ